MGLTASEPTQKPNLEPYELDWPVNKPDIETIKSSKLLQRIRNRLTQTIKINVAKTDLEYYNIEPILLANITTLELSHVILHENDVEVLSSSSDIQNLTLHRVEAPFECFKENKTLTSLRIDCLDVNYHRYNTQYPSEIVQLNRSISQKRCVQMLNVISKCQGLRELVVDNWGLFHYAGVVKDNDEIKWDERINLLAVIVELIQHRGLQQLSFGTYCFLGLLYALQICVELDSRGILPNNIPLKKIDCDNTCLRCVSIDDPMTDYTAQYIENIFSSFNNEWPLQLSVIWPYRHATLSDISRFSVTSITTRTTDYNKESYRRQHPELKYLSILRTVMDPLEFSSDELIHDIVIHKNLTNLSVDLMTKEQMTILAASISITDLTCYMFDDISILKSMPQLNNLRLKRWYLSAGQSEIRHMAEYKGVPVDNDGNIKVDYNQFRDLHIRCLVLEHFRVSQKDLGILLQMRCLQKLKLNTMSSWKRGVCLDDIERMIRLNTQLIHLVLPREFEDQKILGVDSLNFISRLDRDITLRNRQNLMKWMDIVILIAFMRANRDNCLKNSILSLMNDCRMFRRGHSCEIIDPNTWLNIDVENSET